MFSLEAKLIALGIVLIAAISGYVVWTMHERHIGVEECRSEDRTALEQRLTEITHERNLYQMQLENADAGRKIVEDKLGHLATEPAPDIVCQPAPHLPGPVRSLPQTATRSTSGPGTSGEVPAADFKPGPALDRLSRAYAKRCAEYVDAWNRWPTQ